MASSKVCDPRTPDLLSPKIPMAMIAMCGLLIAALAMFRLIEINALEHAKPDE